MAVTAVQMLAAAAAAEAALHLALQVLRHITLLQSPLQAALAAQVQMASSPSHMLHRSY
jgi:hypothetical protein